MTQRIRTALPSTQAPTRNAVSGGRKSVSLDSIPRIHQGLAVATPARLTNKRVRNVPARSDLLIRGAEVLIGGAGVVTRGAEVLIGGAGVVTRGAEVLIGGAGV